MPHCRQYCHKRHILLISSFLVAAAAVVPVFADATGSIVGAVESMLNDILMTGSAEEVTRILTADPQTAYPQVWSMVKGVVDNVITPASYSVLGLYFVTAFVRLGMKYEGFNMEAFMRPFISYIAAFLFVQHTPYLITSFIAVGAGFTGRVAAAGSAAATTNSGVLTLAMEKVRAGSTSMWAALVFQGQLLLPWLASKVLALYMQLVAYSTIIEMFVRACLMPFSFGDLCTRGLDGFGFRYVKSFAAVCLRGGLLVLVAMIMGFFMASAFTNISGAGDWLAMIGKMVVVNAAGALMMSRTGEIAREMVGA